MENIEGTIHFASNKDASSYMLQTFYRRIPIIVQIPDLKDRSGEEKLQMIYQYFLREAGILKKEILVSRTVLQDMQEFRYDGNVGELINIIQYMCGSALLNSEGGIYILPGSAIRIICLPRSKIGKYQRQWKKFGFRREEIPGD